MSKMYNQLNTNDECYTPRYGVEPILKLVPILFKNDVDNSILTKQSKTIKEGE